MKKLYILILLLLPVSVISSGQDPLFTQFYSSPLYLSPSFAGTKEVTRVVLNFRDQWPKLPGDYVTYAISVDQFITKYNSGVGLLVFRDQAAGGIINTTNIGLNYNYHFNITRKWKLAPGIQVYYYIKNINYSKLLFSDQISRDFTIPVSIEMERLSTVKPVQHLDITSSLLGYTDNLWAGFTIDHMLSLNKTLNKDDAYVPLRVSIFGGAKHFIEGRLRRGAEKSITGAFNLLLQDRYKYLDLGAYYTISPMQFGLWYRGLPIFGDSPNIGAVTLQFGYKASNFTIGYSYDYTVSTLITKTGGAHEVSLAYDLAMVEKKKKRRMIPCPTL